MPERKLSKSVISSVARNLIILLMLKFKISPFGRNDKNRTFPSGTNRELCTTLILVNSGHCEEQSDVVRQSTLADGLSMCYEIASLVQRRRLRRVSLAMTILGLCKGL